MEVLPEEVVVAVRLRLSFENRREVHLDLREMLYPVVQLHADVEERVSIAVERGAREAVLQTSDVAVGEQIVEDRGELLLGVHDDRRARDI